jgi:hypothetical protein
VVAEMKARAAAVRAEVNFIFVGGARVGITVDLEFECESCDGDLVN